MPYLLVDFGNLEIGPNLAEVYAKNIGRFESMLLGTYRYGVHPSETGVVVALSTERGARANIFPDERSARQAICLAKRPGMAESIESASSGSQGIDRVPPT